MATRTQAEMITMRIPSNLARGAVAGAIGATATAVWFFAVDVLQGRPFHTPLFLSNSLLRVEAASGMAVALYTVAHYIVFIAVGIIAARVFRWLGVRPGLLAGFVLGFLLFDLIFYAGVIITGTALVRALGWPEVLIGSMVGGVALTTTLALFSDEPSVSWRVALRERRLLREALISGMLGAVAVALWFLILDIFQGRPFFTPAALGSAVLYGARSMDSVVIDVGTVLTYTGIHVAAFGLAGLLVAALMNAAERQPPLLLGIALLFVTFEALFIGLVAIAASWLVDALQWWAIVVANIIAAVAMGAYLLYVHPRLREELTHELEEELI